MNDKNRLKKSLLADFMKEYENLCFEKTDLRSYEIKNLHTAEQLVNLCPEQQTYHLLEASVLINKGKLEEAEKILKKYERNHVLQFRNPEFRACFLYLAGKLTDDKLQKKNIVIQLQKLYQKNPAQPSLYWYLTQLDETFEKNPEKKIAFLEKQWKLGCKQNLLYMEVIRTLRVNPEAAVNMDEFLMQCYIWAQRRRVITKEMAAQIAKHAMKLKQCGKRYEYLLRECYRIFSTKELLGALCSLYIRAGRTDRMAADYYSKGVEFEIKINNLYEYYMMATMNQKNRLLPEPVLLYFLYHDTLSSVQKSFLYKNIVSYGDKKTEIYQKYIRKIENYTVECLLNRKISEELAYLYTQILHPEIFTKEMAEAMADLMFLRKITCTDPRVKEVLIEYPQLESPQRIPLKKQQAYIAVYSPAAVITLADETGNLYRNTISYQTEKLLDEKQYAEVCKSLVQGHAGLLLYLCGKKADRIVITDQNEKYYRQIPRTMGFSEEYRNAVMVRLMEYSAASKQIEEIPAEWFEMDGKSMTREQRGRMITFLVQRRQYKTAYEWLETYGAVYVSANTILKVLTALADSSKTEDELYYRLCYGCFQNGQVNYTSLKYLAGAFLGTCSQMAELWKQAKAFGVDTFELEERILMQMMFCGAEVKNHFDIYLSYNQREPKEYMKKAYLTYFSREIFLKNKAQDNRFYFLLEEELFSGGTYAEICHLAYLKYLSEREQLSGMQKNLAAADLREFLAKKCCFEFMKKFGKLIPEALVLEDKFFVEYYAPATSKVWIHYVTENDEGEKEKNVCRLYPTCMGVFSKSFTMFEGEKLTYYLTEITEDGEEKISETVTAVMQAEFTDSETKYSKINQMRKLAAEGKRKECTEKLCSYRFLEMVTEQLFDVK